MAPQGGVSRDSTPPGWLEGTAIGPILESLSQGPQWLGDSQTAQLLPGPAAGTGLGS